MNCSKKTCSVERTLTQEDFERFAALSGDHNPIHVDPVFSSRTRFGRTVSHGLLLNTILRGLLDQLLPGARQLSQQLMFPAPTFAGEALRFEARIVSDDGVQARVEFACTRVADGVVTCTGSSVMTTPDR